jgi:RNA 2',3'-cyclic 3'-phosphodiesterase
LEKKHYFWAVRIPSESKHILKNQVQLVQDYFPFKRWVHVEDYHITLSFLGFAEPDKLKQSINLVGEFVEQIKSFSLYVNCLGVFGNKNSPRIFWAGVEKEEKLFQLQKGIAKACKQAGFTLETRPYSPHITLARNWEGEIFNPQVVEEHNPFSSEKLSFLVQEIVLYQTNLEKTPKYEAIENFPLLSE